MTLPAPSARPDVDTLRLRRYLVVNVVGLWLSVLVLLGLAVGGLGSRAVNRDIAVLAVAGLIVTASWLLARRGKVLVASIMLVVTNWIVAAAITWVSPFIMPVSLIVILLPMVIVIDYLPWWTRYAVVAGTVLLSGAIAAGGEYRRANSKGSSPLPEMSVPQLAMFVPIVTTVVVVGIWQHMRRLTDQAREITESRARVAQAADDARRAIERDLHDGAQQQLAALAIELTLATRLIEAESPGGIPALKELEGHLQVAIRELRDLARGIYPALLSERGLAAALPAAGRRAQTACSVDVGGVGRHDRRVEAAVYFCCVEAIHNADKYAEARRITVVVRDIRPTEAVDATAGRDGWVGLEFSVTDDGNGLAVSNGTGRGLTGMQDRIMAAGGELLIESVPGRGTTVTGTFTR